MERVHLLLLYVVLSCVMVINGQAPCYDALNGYSSSVVDGVSAFESAILYDGYPQSDVELNTLANDIMDSASEWVLWLAVAWGDEIVFMQSCHLPENFDEKCDQVLAVNETWYYTLANEMNGQNLTSHFPNGDLMIRDPLEYYPSSRPWFGVDGWSRYNFINTFTGNITGNGFSYVITNDTYGFTIVSDYYEPAGSCSVNIEETLCPGSVWNSENVAETLKLATLPGKFQHPPENYDSLKEMLFELSEILPEGAFWSGIAWEDDIIVFQDCNLPGNLHLGDELCAQTQDDGYLFSYSSLNFNGDHNWRHVDSLNNTIEQIPMVEYIPTERPWYTSNGWVSYVFVQTLELGYSYVRPLVEGRGMVISDHYPEGSCIPSFELSPCPGITRRSDAISVSESDLELFTDENSAIDLANQIIELTDNQREFSIAWENEYIGVFDCNYTDSVGDICDSLLSTSNSLFVNIVSYSLYGDYDIHSFTLDGEEITRDSETYYAIEQYWFRENGWNSKFQLTPNAYSLSLTANLPGRPTIFVNYGEDIGLCDQDTIDAPCDEAISVPNSLVSGVEAVSMDNNIGIGFTTEDEAFEIAEILAENIENIQILAVVYDNENFVVIINCEIVGTSPLCDQSEESIVFSIGSMSVYGDMKLRSFASVEDSLVASDLDYIPSERPWFLASGWTRVDFDEAEELSGEGLGFVSQQNEVVVMGIYWEGEGVCEEETETTTSSGSELLLVVSMILFVL